MALPILRTYYIKTVTANAWATLIPTVPANRALVVSKLSIFGRLSSQTGFRLFDGTAEQLYNFDLPLNLYEQYSETGIVVPAGWSLQIWSRLANAYDAMAFGQEVDN